MEKQVLVFIPDRKFQQQFWESIVNDGYDVYLIDDLEEAGYLLDKNHFDYFFVKSAPTAEVRQLVENCKQKNRLAVVRFFKTEDELVFGQFDNEIQLELLIDNFNLVKTILSGELANDQKNYSEFAQITEALSRKMHLTNDKTALVIAAAYIHDLSKYIVNVDSPLFKQVDLIRMTCEFLKPFDYSPVVIQVLKEMYIKRNDSQSNTYSMLSQLLTAVSIYTHCKFKKNKYLSEEYAVLNEHLRTEIKEYADPVILDTLLELISQDIVEQVSEGETCSLTIFAQHDFVDASLIEQLKENDLIVYQTEMFDEILEFKQSGKMDILVIAAESTAVDTVELIDDILETGVSLHSTPSYLITDTVAPQQLYGLYQKGLEDIINVGEETDSLLIKLNRSKQRIIKSPSRQLQILNSAGTFGTLANMNLIDLLQTMKVSGKVCLISVTSESHQLSIYVEDGLIKHAECDNVQGEEVIYSALNWKEGIWCIDMITRDAIPTQNINKSIDSILLEGCHLLDESNRIA